jgi:DNA-binding CsgD family transcriptional regulator
VDPPTSRACGGESGAESGGALATASCITGESARMPLTGACATQSGHEPAPQGELPSGLSLREGDVFHLAARGLTTQQIADWQNTSPETADPHTKTGVSTRAAAALSATQHVVVAPVQT